MGGNTIHQSCVVRLYHPDGDYYATEPAAAEDILRIEPQIQHIWECACGEGHLAKEFLKHGKLAHATDVFERGYVRQEGTLDFLHYDGRFGTPYVGDIVTNPPYDMALEFVLKALDVVEKGRYVAMFLPLTFAETHRRYEQIFSRTPPLRVWAYVKRRHCARNGNFETEGKGNLKAYAWYVWQKGNYPGASLKWIPPHIENNRLKLEAV